MLTLPARAALVLALTLATIAALRFVHPFLAITHQTGSDVLIVEGWIGDRLFEQVATTYRHGHYRRVLVVIGVYEGDILSDSAGQYYDEYLEELLVKYGVPGEAVDTLFCAVARRERTYHCARVARRWLREHREVSLRSLDVATLGPHARRSRLLYDLAFEHRVPVGVIALPDQAYDPERWWRYSEGVREVMSEGLGYVYAKLIFRPPSPPDDDAPFEIPIRQRPARAAAS